MNKKPEHSRSSRAPFWQSGIASRPPRSKAVGLIALAAIVAAGAIGSQTLMEWLRTENRAADIQNKSSVSAPTNNVHLPTAPPTEAAPQVVTSNPHTLTSPPIVAGSDEEAPLTDDMLEPDGDNAPPEADFEHAYEILQRTNSTDHVMAESEYLNALQVVSTDLTALSDFGVDAVWAYALDHRQEQRTIEALMPRLQSQDPAVVARARDAIASLSETLQNPKPNPTQTPNETTVEEYVTRLGRAALTGADEQQRFESIAELGGHQHNAAITALAQALNDPEPRNRNQAVLSLANIATHNSANRDSIRALLEKTKYSGDAELTATAEQVLEALDAR